MIEDCIAVVMAGGQSKRMGCDKATLLLGEQTLLQRVVANVQPIFPQLMVSVREARHDINLLQIFDEFPNAGPLAGLYAGLVQAKKNKMMWIFAVATDMPFVKPALIEKLAKMRAGFQAVVPVVRRHSQPLAAFYSVDCLDTIQSIFSGTGKRSLRAALDQLKVCYVDESEMLVADPDLKSFFDLDTPQDLAVARSRKFGLYDDQ